MSDFVPPVIVMDSFDSIFQRAAERKGGADELEALLPKTVSQSAL